MPSVPSLSRYGENFVENMAQHIDFITFQAQQLLIGKIWPLLQQHQAMVQHAKHLNQTLEMAGF
jgi:hypothetical protein